MPRIMIVSANQFRFIPYWKRLIISNNSKFQFKKMIVPVKFYLAITAAIVAMLVSACGQKSSENKAATQVAVKVNGSEISVHQVNAVLGRAPEMPPEQASMARKEVVERLVSQQLAIDQAVEKKLDRTPDVLTAIEGAKREILARAYLDTIVASQPKPAPEEIKKYYGEHPQLFAKRRVFQLQELLVERKPEVLEGLRQLVAGAKNLDEMSAWLKTKKFNSAAT